MACDIERHCEPQKCFEFITKILKQQPTEYVIQKIVPVKNEVLGFLGQYYYLKCKRVDPENLSQNDITLFLKMVPSAGTKQQLFIKQSGVFNNEIEIYKLFPKILNSCDKFTPKCILEMKDSFLVLEDMSSNGFLMANKFVPLDFSHVKIVVETLSKFHSRTIIFEDKHNQNMLEFLKEQKTDLHAPDVLMQGAIQTNIEGICAIINFIKNDLDDKGWERVKDKIREEAKTYYQKIKSSDYRKVLCHSDLWNNNLLFKYDSIENPVECCLVDFQLTR